MPSVLWPQHIGSRPRFAHAYVQNARLQEIHAIYGQFIGPARPAPIYPGAISIRGNQRIAGGYGAILVGDHFPMPTSPAAMGADTRRVRPSSAAQHRRQAPVYKPPTELLDEANKLANKPLLPGAP